MDPTLVFCPNLACPARCQIGQGDIGIHSRKDTRFLCTACHKTFSATKGTLFYRLHTLAETVVLVVTLLAHGCPVQALVAAFGFDERTVAAWWARAGGQCQAVQAHLVEQPRDLGQVQADEIRVKKQGGIVWMAHLPAWRHSDAARKAGGDQHRLHRTAERDVPGTPRAVGTPLPVVVCQWGSWFSSLAFRDSYGQVVHTRHLTDFRRT